MKIVAALRTPRAGAVEMPPPGKRGKLQKLKRISHSFHRAWKSGTGQPDSHISTAPAAGLISEEGDKKDEEKIQFQLTDPGHFKHHKNASVASLRKRSASSRNQ
jgi:hypothetical protein